MTPEQLISDMRDVTAHLLFGDPITSLYSQADLAHFYTSGAVLLLEQPYVLEDRIFSEEIVKHTQIQFHFITHAKAKYERIRFALEEFRHALGLNGASTYSGNCKKYCTEEKLMQSLYLPNFKWQGPFKSNKSQYALGSGYYQHRNQDVILKSYDLNPEYLIAELLACQIFSLSVESKRSNNTDLVHRIDGELFLRSPQLNRFEIMSPSKLSYKRICENELNSEFTYIIAGCLMVGEQYSLNHNIGFYHDKHQNWKLAKADHSLAFKDIIQQATAIMPKSSKAKPGLINHIHYFPKLAQTTEMANALKIVATSLQAPDFQRSITQCLDTVMKAHRNTEVNMGYETDSLCYYALQCFAKHIGLKHSLAKDTEILREQIVSELTKSLLLRKSAMLMTAFFIEGEQQAKVDILAFIGMFKSLYLDPSLLKAKDIDYKKVKSLIPSIGLAAFKRIEELAGKRTLIAILKALATEGQLKQDRASNFGYLSYEDLPSIPPFIDQLSSPAYRRGNIVPFRRVPRKGT